MNRTDLRRRAWRLRRGARATAAWAVRASRSSRALLVARNPRATSRGVTGRRRSPAMSLGLGAAAVFVLIGVALLGHATLGRLGDPFALLVALPPLAHALAAFGLRDLLARRIAAIRTGERRLVAAYGLWLMTSALLTLDVAAVASGSVAMAIGRDHGERRWQLGAAVVGSNVGSLLFPFSNLTNLVLVSGSGIGLVAYLGAAVPAQIAAAVAGGALLLVRFAQDQDADRDEGPAISDPPLRYGPARGDRPGRVDQASILAAALAAAVAIVAIAGGLTGGSLVWPFVGGSAILTGWAIAVGRLAPETPLRTAPLGAFAVILVAGLLSGPIAALAGGLPRPADTSPLSLAEVALVGGLLAALVNNLPAAAFGAAWLGVASPAILVAFLVGTNFGSIATPHGSVATMLARASAHGRGPDMGVRVYLANAWRYAALTAFAALVALVAIR